jgi:hypothetical protein
MLSLSQHHLLLVNSCKDRGASKICKKDSSTEHRLYDIRVTATDQAGNEGEANCSVIVYSGILRGWRNEVCGKFAVHARTNIFFAGGLTTIDGGDVGLSPGTSITGRTPQIDNGEVVDNSDDFAASAVTTYAAAMKVRPDGKSMAIEMGGVTFTPGTYRSGSAINIAVGTTVVLDGNFEDDPSFLFQAVTTLITAAGATITLINGAKAEHVVWVLGTAATLGANSILEGSILAGTDITFGTGSKINGCVIAQSAVTFAGASSIKADPGPGQTLKDIAPDLRADVAASKQRFDLASLSLER